MFPKILSIHVGTPETIEVTNANRQHQVWRSAIAKRPVKHVVRLGRLNLDGDAQADLKHHGGPDKAVCVYAESHYAFWRGELRLNISEGGFGENLTVSELTEEKVCIGDVWRIGNATVQVSQPRQPCWKLSRWWGIYDLAVKVQQSGRTGWYLRVLDEGSVGAGASVTLIDRLHANWTIAAANTLMHRDRDNTAGARELAGLPELSSSWRKTLTRRLQKRSETNPNKRLFGDPT